MAVFTDFIFISHFFIRLKNVGLLDSLRSKLSNTLEFFRFFFKDRPLAIVDPTLAMRSYAGVLWLVTCTYRTNKTVFFSPKSFLRFFSSFFFIDMINNDTGTEWSPYSVCNHKSD